MISFLTAKRLDSFNPTSKETRAFSDSAKSNSPAIAFSVIAETSLAIPAFAASKSITSCAIRVESISSITNLLALRIPLPCSTARSIL